jgi:hypothetical protein
MAVLAVLLLLARRRTRGRRRARRGFAPGPAAAGAIYDLLNEDKRNAIEIIVEEKAEARDPERAAGNLPDIENPRAPR